MIAPSDEALAIIEDFIVRYLADELDLSRLTEWVTILNLTSNWPDGDGQNLLRMAAIDLYWFRVGDWPEETLRASLAHHLEEVGKTGIRPGGPMMGQQMLDLLRAGYRPPGTRYGETRVPTVEEIKAMQRRRDH